MLMKLIEIERPLKSKPFHSQLQSKAKRKVLKLAQRTVALRVAAAYCTVLGASVLVVSDTEH